MGLATALRLAQKCPASAAQVLPIRGVALAWGHSNLAMDRRPVMGLTDAPPINVGFELLVLPIQLLHGAEYRME
jgi:hypothetical protein